jgi:hypothetical protein
MIERVMAPELSPEGAARREAILSLALRAARRRRRHRHLARATAAASLALALAAAAIVALRPSRPGGTPQIASSHPAPPPPTFSSPPKHPRPSVTITRLATYPGIADRLAVRASPGAAAPLPRLSDDELLARLAEAGHPAGLAYVDGSRPMLVFHEHKHY